LTEKYTVTEKHIQKNEKHNVTEKHIQKNEKHTPKFIRMTFYSFFLAF
jgi:hypothetical protein